MPDTGGPGYRVLFAAIPGVTSGAVLRQPLLLPVGPLGDLDQARTAAFTEYQTLGAGVFSQPSGGAPVGGGELDDFSIETMAFDEGYQPNWVINPDVTSDVAWTALNAILDAKSPVDLFIYPLRGEEEVSMQVTFRKVARTRKHGEANRLYFQIDLKEWRLASVKRRALGRAGLGKSGAVANGVGRKGPLPTTHLLTSKDTLRSLSQLYYGTSDGWRLIANANGIRKIGGSTGLLQTQALVENLNFTNSGGVLKIPSPIGVPTTTGPGFYDPKVGRVNTVASIIGGNA